jgi:hypothetical protein
VWICRLNELKYPEAFEMIAIFLDLRNPDKYLEISDFGSGNCLNSIGLKPDNINVNE